MLGPIRANPAVKSSSKPDFNSGEEFFVAMEEYSVRNKNLSVVPSYTSVLTFWVSSSEIFMLI